MACYQHPSCCSLCELVDIRQAMRWQEALIAYNRTYIFTSTRKIHTQEENHNSELVVIMENFLQQKKQIKDLEDECTTLCHQGSSLFGDPQLTTSIHKMSISSNVEENIEEETIYRMHVE
jgi:hypothetical protein